MVHNAKISCLVDETFRYAQNISPGGSLLITLFSSAITFTRHSSFLIGVPDGMRGFNGVEIADNPAPDADVGRIVRTYLSHPSPVVSKSLRKMVMCSSTWNPAA